MQDNNSKIFLHIGFPKTGSSFFQHHLYLNNNDYKIFSYYSKIVKLILEYFKVQSLEIKEEILTIIKNEKSKKILITSEGILDHQNNHFKDNSKSYKDFKDNLKKSVIY